MERLMGQPYVGEIRLFAGNFAPSGWMSCQGQLLPISENETLFNLIGTTYGGDGQSTFALPDLQSRVPIHQGNGFILAETGGAEQVTLTTQQMPAHSHALAASTATASSRSAVGGVPAALPAEVAWSSAAADESMGLTSEAGGSQPHDNMQPYLGLSFIISLFGVYPSPT
jgi:microcystin-dependent protein